jgi:hypothetical protein
MTVRTHAAATQLANTVGGLMEALATLVHGAGYLVVTALTAWIVFEKFGLGFWARPGSTWTLLWAIALGVGQVVWTPDPQRLGYRHRPDLLRCGRVR